MCSTQCETPVVPGSSLRPPTRYHIHTPTSGRSRTSRRITCSPLSRVVCVNEAGLTCVAIGLHATGDRCPLSLWERARVRAGSAPGCDRLTVLDVAGAGCGHLVL